jgi:hypothetical protein
MRPWLVLLLAACPKGGRDPSTRLNYFTSAADVAWADRADRGLAEAAKPLLAGWREFPTHPEVLWRLVRLKVAEGLAAPSEEEALRLYADGRAFGLQCLDAVPAFDQQRQQGNWAEAVARLPGDARRACAAWAGLSWARWIATQGGEATALDLERIDPLVDYAQQSPSEELRSLGLWSRGILTAVRPFWAGGDPVAARAQIERAVEAEPEELARWADLLLLTVAPVAPEAEVEELQSEILARRARTPEDVRARARVEALDGR